MRHSTFHPELLTQWQPLDRRYPTSRLKSSLTITSSIPAWLKCVSIIFHPEQVRSTLPLMDRKSFKGSTTSRPVAMSQSIPAPTHLVSMSLNHRPNFQFRQPYRPIRSQANLRLAYLTALPRFNSSPRRFPAYLAC